MAQPQEGVGGRIKSGHGDLWPYGVAQASFGEPVKLHQRHFVGGEEAPMFWVEFEAAAAAAKQRGF